MATIVRLSSILPIPTNRGQSMKKKTTKTKRHDSTAPYNHLRSWNSRPLLPTAIPICGSLQEWRKKHIRLHSLHTWNRPPTPPPHPQKGQYHYHLHICTQTQRHSMQPQQDTTTTTPKERHLQIHMHLLPHSHLRRTNKQGIPPKMGRTWTSHSTQTLGTLRPHPTLWNLPTHIQQRQLWNYSQHARKKA